SITPDSLLISERAHLTLPFHRELDALGEAGRGSSKLGTTKRGIGPTYMDKAQRCGLRLVDALDLQAFTDTLWERLTHTNEALAAAGFERMDLEAVGKETLAAVERLLPHMANTIAVLHGAMEDGKKVLFEGAQGTFLDLDFGTYPFVTSSNTTAGGACTGSGVPPNRIDEVIGVCKAYTTRVGTGPFPTQDEGFSDYLHAKGREFGATTGRERRCGWLDLVLLRQATMVNGLTSLAVTNLDGLDEQEVIQVCTHYELDGKTLDLPPARVVDFARVVPQYESLPGWKEDLSGVSHWADLPSPALNYLEMLERFLRVPVAVVGVGPDREQTLLHPDVPLGLTLTGEPEGAKKTFLA
ncbi:MAG: adenylosuccinate synthase, partial [Verrucomicrobiota bacterium]